MVFDLIISEVFIDGTDEWIEITNIGKGGFQGNITIVGAKSTPLSLTNIALNPGESKLFGDTMAHVSTSAVVSKTGLGLSMIDTAPLNLTMTLSGQVVDTFNIHEYWVQQYNDKKTSFEKIGNIATAVTIERVIHAQSGYRINPGVYFLTGMILENVSLPL
jgi:hypothetical protein